MRDGSANHSSATKPEAKSLCGHILAVTAYGSGFCPDPAYPKDGKPLRTKILEGGSKKNVDTPSGLSGGFPTKVKIPTLAAKNAARMGHPIPSLFPCYSFTATAPGSRRVLGLELPPSLLARLLR